MPFHRKRAPRNSTTPSTFSRVFTLSLLLPSPAFQQNIQNPKPVTSVIPFVGCPSDGQVGPLSAPTGRPIKTQLPQQVALQLALFQSAQGLSVLGPRDWRCVGIYGSGGESLIVTPQKIPATMLFSNAGAGTKPAVALGRRDGGTSGRDSVARIISRVFPAHRNLHWLNRNRGTRFLKAPTRRTSWYTSVMTWSSTALHHTPTDSNSFWLMVTCRFSAWRCWLVAIRQI
jgi:hypothetical protein